MPNTIRNGSFDVYAYGVIAHSISYVLQDTFPVQSGYAEIREEANSIGGEAANTALVLARLGLKVKLGGNWLGNDDKAAFIKRTLKKNAVDISGVLCKKNYTSPQEILFVDAKTKTILGTYGKLLKQKAWVAPNKSDIKNASVISLDPFFGKESVAVAQYAKELYKPLVTVDCHLENKIIACATIIILAGEYVKEAYPSYTLQEVFRKYQRKTEAFIIITCGDKRIFYGSVNTKIQVCQPYRIKAIDTTGAGDAFRAGIIYGLLKNWGIDQSIEFASAVAALVCQSYPGVLNAPAYGQVEVFMKQWGSSLDK